MIILPDCSTSKESALQLGDLYNQLCETWRWQDRHQFH